jgi:negative regulator of sigma E activity
MLNFDPNPRRIYTVLGASSYDVVTTSDSDHLPESVAGYTRVDTYRGPNDSIHSFYSDGLFSYSVFQINGEGVAEPFAHAETMKLDSGSYRWFLTASELWVQWSRAGKTYVLVGDLPPDHLEKVLAELPHAESGNLLSRIWNGIFG